MNIAVIPARGGSKRIPLKNSKIFCGQPIISWTIQKTIQSQLFDKIIVSTDQEEIAQIARKEGAETPFLRPKTLSDDFTGTTEVIAHSISWMQEQHWEINFVCCIYPTSVFVEIEDLAKGYEAIQQPKWQYAISVTEFEYPIYRAFHKHPDGGVEMIFPQHATTRSQDLPQAYHDAAQFYWGKPNAWTQNLKFFESHSSPILIPQWRVLDIDTPEDWKRAEMLFEMIHKS